MVGVGLGIELVGIADNLFLQGLWFPAWQTRSCMALSDTGMTGEALLTQQLTTNLSMTDVRFCTVTMNGWGITLVNTNIVQHSSFLDELFVDRQLLMLAHNL